MSASLLAKMLATYPSGQKPPIRVLFSYELYIVLLMFPKTPGPGTYEVMPGISPRGAQFYSKFESSRAAVFNPPQSKRFDAIRNISRHINLCSKRSYS